MSPESWLRVKNLFEAALEIKKQQRNEFLTAQCNGDSEVLFEVNKLLSSFEEASEFMEQPAVNEVADVILTSKGFEKISIPHYKLVKEIGCGGMGSVYLAVRDDNQFKKQVAVKIINTHLASKEFLQRFRNERQILAALEHPNIARLLDGGTTDEGLPYFVMEYIDGKPILDYCDENNLTTKGRLEHFTQICSAVAYAHKNLIVHRDIKPSNILVTKDGVPKLLDFGIAKPLDRNFLNETNTVTMTGGQIMTPEYASPEQVKGESVTTSSDVYSLGVLLYELMTGHRPYQLKKLTPLEIVKVICETEPDLPSSSTAKQRDAETGENNSQYSISNPHSLKGDIDNIVLMALRKEPSRRYSSVEHFSEDIKRHLAGLPVTARPSTFKYRVEKFVKRNKLPVALASFLLMLLIGFSITEFVQSRRVARERDKAMAERERAEKVASFMAELFKSANPNEANGKEVTDRKILDRGVERVRTELKDQPAVQSKLFLTIAEAYYALSVFDKAEELGEEAVALNRMLYGNENQDTLASLDFLGTVKFWRKKTNEAIAIMQEVVSVRRKINGESIELANSLSQLAVWQKDSGQVSPDEIEKNYTESVAIARKVLPASDIRLEELLTDAAVFFLEIRLNFKESENLCREALAIAESHSSEKPLDVAAANTCLGRSLGSQARYEEAEQHLKLALQIRKEFYKEIENQSVSNAYHNLGFLYLISDQTEKAEPLLMKAYEIRRKINSPLRDQTLMEIGVLRHKQGKLEESEKILRQVVLPSHSGVGQNNLADVLIDRGKLEEAEKILRNNISIMSTVVMKQYRYYADALRLLGICLKRQNRSDEAKIIMRESYEIYLKFYGENHPLTGRTSSEL